MVYHLCLTNECQCGCFYCSQHVKEGCGEYLFADHAVEFAKKAAELGYDTIELTGGEPLLHPEFTKIIEEISSRCPAVSMTLSTNGILLEQYLPKIKDSNVRIVRIHVDTMLAENYKKITGRSEQLNKILGGLWKAVAANLEVELVVKLHPYSADQVGVILSMAKKYPIHIKLEDLVNGTETYKERDILLRWKSATGKLTSTGEHLYTGEDWKGTIEVRFQNET